MPDTDTDITDQLASYGRWLESDTGLELSGPAPVEPEPIPARAIDLGPTTSEIDHDRDVLTGTVERSGRRPWLLVAAVVALIVGSVTYGSDFVDRNDEDGPVHTSSDDVPSGPLFMLPSDESGWSADSGSTGLLDSQLLGPALARTVVVGRRDANGYRDITTVEVSDVSDETPPAPPFWSVTSSGAPPEPEQLDWVERMLDSGEVLVAAGRDLTTMAAQRDGRWVVATVDSVREPALTELMEDVVVDGDGAVRLVGTSEFEVIDQVEGGDPADVVASEVSDGNRNAFVEVVTGAPLLAWASVADGIVPQPVGGRDGWRYTSSLGSDVGAVSWRATPNSTVTVLGEMPIAELTAIAESLETVDQSTWVSAIEGASADHDLVTSSEDPAGPLYVSPAEASGWTLVNGDRGSAEPATDGPQPVRRVVVGRPVGEGFVAPISLSLSEPSDVAPEAPVLDAPVVNADGVPVPAETEWSPRTLDSREVLVVEGETFIAMAAQHNGRWMQAQVERDREAALVEVFEHVVVEDDETVHLRAGSGLEVVESVRIEAATPQVFTYAEVEGASAQVVIETGTTPTPLLAAWIADRIAPVGDGDGWTATRDGGEGPWNAIVWQVTPNSSVFVSGELPLEELTAIAESLEIVDEARWEAAFPDAPEVSGG